MPLVTYRDLTTLEEFAGVVELEREIWGPGYDEVVPVPILAITVMRGGILVGAFDDDRMNELLGINGTDQFLIYLATVGKKEHQ